MDNCDILVDKIVNEKRCCLISGQAGTGKSTLLKKLVIELKKHYKKEEIQITAPTGIACVNIGNAKTIHNWLGLKLADKDSNYYMNNIYGQFPTTVLNMKNTQVLIIDEISMITPKMFMLIDRLAKYIRNNRMPFGGIIVVMFGDFCQLEPISKEDTDIKFVFQTDLWKTMNIYRLWLRKVYRQIGDDKYKDMLNRIRRGKMNFNDIRRLRSKIVYKNLEQKIEKDGYNQVKITLPLLTTHRKKVAENNKKMLMMASKQLNTPIVKFKPEITTKYTKNYLAQNGSRTNYSDEQLKNMFPVYNVVICEGCQVMMRCNEYLGSGICNGTIGIVHQIDHMQNVFVKFRVNGQLTQPILIPRHTFKMKINGGYLELSQLPLSLAYALSIHRCQGISLEEAIVDLRGIFCDAQAYVALSRLTSFDGLTIKGMFDTRKFKSCDEALEFETDYELLDTIETLNKYMINDLANIVLGYMDYF